MSTCSTFYCARDFLRDFGLFLFLRLASRLCHLQTIIHTREMFLLLLDKLTQLGYNQYFASYVYRNTFERSCALSKDMECFKKNYTVDNMCARIDNTSSTLKFG